MTRQEQRVLAGLAAGLRKLMAVVDLFIGQRGEPGACGKYHSDIADAYGCSVCNPIIVPDRYTPEQRAQASQGMARPLVLMLAAHEPARQPRLLREEATA